MLFVTQVCTVIRYVQNNAFDFTGHHIESIGPKNIIILPIRPDVDEGPLVRVKFVFHTYPPETALALTLD